MVNVLYSLTDSLTHLVRIILLCTESTNLDNRTICRALESYGQLASLILSSHWSSEWKIVSGGSNSDKHRNIDLAVPLELPLDLPTNTLLTYRGTLWSSLCFADNNLLFETLAAETKVTLYLDRESWSKSTTFTTIALLDKSILKRSGTNRKLLIYMIHGCENVLEYYTWFISRTDN